MTTEPTKDILLQFFTGLGSTHQAIAQKLKELEYRGVPRRMDLCVLAVALNDAGITWPWPMVSHGGVNFNDCQIINWHGMPAPAMNFQALFDTDQYPDLVCTPQEARQAIERSLARNEFKWRIKR